MLRDLDQDIWSLSTSCTQSAIIHAPRTTLTAAHVHASELSLTHVPFISPPILVQKWWIGWHGNTLTKKNDRPQWALYQMVLLISCLIAVTEQILKQKKRGVALIRKLPRKIVIWADRPIWRRFRCFQTDTVHRSLPMRLGMDMRSTIATEGAPTIMSASSVQSSKSRDPSNRWRCRIADDSKGGRDDWEHDDP
jgi:hypothetical protein